MVNAQGGMPVARERRALEDLAYAIFGGNRKNKASRIRLCPDSG